MSHLNYNLVSSKRNLDVFLSKDSDSWKWGPTCFMGRGQLTLESSKLISTAERSLRIRGQGSQGGGGTLNKSVKYSNKAN